VTRAWIDNNKRPQLRIDFDTYGRDHTHKAIVHRSVESTSVENQLDFVVEHVRNRLRHVLEILISALTHHVPEQNISLSGVDHVLHCVREHAKRCFARFRGGRAFLSW